MTCFPQLSGSVASEHFKCSFDYTTRKLFGGFATVDSPTVQLVNYSDKCTLLSRLWKELKLRFFIYEDFEAKRLISDWNVFGISFSWNWERSYRPTRELSNDRPVWSRRYDVKICLFQLFKRLEDRENGTSIFLSHVLPIIEAFVMKARYTAELI